MIIQDESSQIKMKYSEFSKHFFLSNGPIQLEKKWKISRATSEYRADKKSALPFTSFFFVIFDSYEWYKIDLISVRLTHLII